MKLFLRHHNFIYGYLGVLFASCLFLLKWIYRDHADMDPVFSAMIGLALLQLIWCLFVYSMFRALNRKKKYTSIRYIAAAFVLGCLIQTSGYLNDVRFQQVWRPGYTANLADAKLHYMGLIFAVWFAFILLVEHITTRPVKKPLYSIILSLWHLCAMTLHYTFLTFFLDNMYSLTMAWDWEAYTRGLLWWSCTSLPYLIVTSFLAAVIVSWATVRITAAATGIKKNQFHQTVSSDSCRRLILYVAPEDIVRVPSISAYWLFFLFLNGNNAALTRNLSAFRKGNDYFSCYMSYANGELQTEDYDEVFCLYIHNFVFGPELSSENDQKILDFLKSMEQKGFQVIVHQYLSTDRDKYLMEEQKKLQNADLLYSPWLAVRDGLTRIPMDQINQYKTRRQAKTIYLDIRQLLLDKDEDPFLQDQLYSLCTGSGVVAQFYTLLKMAEYCIHIRALHNLCRSVVAAPDICEKIINPSFGTLNDLQTDPELIFQDPELAVALRWLDMLSCTKSTSQIKTRRVSFTELCQVMVRLRNRFVGHGTMIYSIDEQVLAPLAISVRRLIQVFLDGPHHLPSDARVLPSMPGYAIPALLETETERFCFSGIDRQGYISYLDFHTGRYAAAHRDQPLERIHLDLPVCSDPTVFLPFPEPEKSVPLSDPSAEKARLQFLKKWSAKLISMWTFYQDTDIFDHLPADLNCPYMTKPYFEEEYARKILRRKAAPELYHDFLLETSRNIIHLFEASVWDRILDSWDDEIPFLRKYVMEKAQEGELLPGIPLKIGILGRPAHTPINPYPWMLSLEVQNFDTYEALLGWASNASGDLTRRRLAKSARKQEMEQELFEHRTAFYQELLKELDCPSPFVSQNLYFSGFFKNIFDYEDMETSAMAIFDFLEFTMLCVQYYLLGSQRILPERSLVNPDFQSMGENILSFCPDDAPIRENIHGRCILLPQHCLELQDRLTQYLPFAIQGDRMSFKDLTCILRLLRNATRGHGFIQEDNAGILWQLLLYYALICCRFLNLPDFQLDVSSEKILIGYTDACIFLSDYFIVENGVPCPLWEMKKQKRQYINYFHGIYVVPDLVRP